MANTNDSQVQRVLAKALFCQDNKILIVKKNDSRWELPGGKIEFGEEPKATLQRELKEELTFDKIVVGKIINVCNLLFRKNNKDYQYIAIIFECTLDRSQKIKLSPEHTDYRWILPTEADQFDINKDYKKSIKLYR